MSTLFDFGWNAADSDARELPWNQPKPGTGQGQIAEGVASPSRLGVASRDANGGKQLDPVPVSELCGHNSFVAVVDGFQADAVEKYIISGLNSFREEIRKMASVNLDKYYNEKKAASFKRSPFLKPENIPARGLAFTIIDEPREGNYSDLLLDVKTPKGNYTASLKTDSVLLGQFCQQFGKKAPKWPGKKGVFVLAKGKYINLQPTK